MPGSNRRRRSEPAGPMLSRRGLLAGSTVGLILSGCSTDDAAAPTTTGRRSDAAPSEPTTTSRATPPLPGCVLTPELTAGPYYLDGPLARSDITEGRPGTPLEFRVRVLALPGCTPLTGAAVDVWHCDAGGEYSGFNGNSLEATAAQGRNDRRFLRGVQVTDADGIASFTTIFPGWYEGRTVHIHLKVHDGGSLGSTYDGGHVAHVGQAFFDEAITADVLGSGAYTAHTGTRTTNDEDSIFRQAGSGAITTMEPKRAGGEQPGFVGEFTCMVDPSATPPPAPLF
ncbi:MAG: intradiol ring-cleavage dioxygenase [Actinobacteria bacterium]|nr:intradiol ring-cleavage dioxygenase [Actinomycetota bacterium]